MRPSCCRRLVRVARSRNSREIWAIAGRHQWYFERGVRSETIFYNVRGMNPRCFLSDPDGISQTRPAAQSGRHAAHIFGSARLGTQVSCRRGTPRRRRPRRRALRRSPSHKSCHGRLQPLARFPNWGWRGKRRLRPVGNDACWPCVMRQSRARNRPTDPRF
jgi:hypothetical protein